MTTIWSRNLNEPWKAQLIEATFVAAADGRPFELLAFGQGTDRNTAMLVPQEVQAWVNGQPVIAGFKVLSHRDEIQVGADTWYYSSESQPLRGEFHLAAGQRRPRCGVCRVAIEDGETTVTCPRCGRVYHQLDANGERPAKHCFTYRDRCLCGHPTSLGGESVWQPDEE